MYERILRQAFIWWEFYFKEKLLDFIIVQGSSLADVGFYTFVDHKQDSMRGLHLHKTCYEKADRLVHYILDSWRTYKESVVCSSVRIVVNFHTHCWLHPNTLK